MYALLVGISFLLIWYGMGKVRTKQGSAPTGGDYWGMIRKTSVNHDSEGQEKDKDEYYSAPDRVYYSTPGRSYMAYIYKGRILKK